MYQIASRRCDKCQISMLGFMFNDRVYYNNWDQQLVLTSAHDTYLSRVYRMDLGVL